MEIVNLYFSNQFYGIIKKSLELNNIANCIVSEHKNGDKIIIAALDIRQYSILEAFTEQARTLDVKYVAYGHIHIPKQKKMRKFVSDLIKTGVNVNLMP